MGSYWWQNRLLLAPVFRCDTSSLLSQDLKSAMYWFQWFCCYSVAKSRSSLGNPMNWSTPCCPVLQYPQSLLKFKSLSRWCHPAISSSVVPFSSRLQSFPASGSFPMRWLFASDGQRTGASVLASVFPTNIQGWFPLGWTGLISWLSKGLSVVFCTTTVWKQQFFGAQPSLWANSHIRTCLLEKP